MRNRMITTKKDYWILGTVIIAIFIMGALSMGCTSASSSTTSVTPVETPTITLTPTYQETVVTPAATTSPWKTYQNSKYGFSMDYPSDWEVSEEKPTIGAPDGLAGKIEVVNFFTPSITRCDSEKLHCVIVRGEVAVGVDSTPGTKEVAEYYVKDVAKISTDNNIEISKNMAFFKMANQNAERLHYTLDNEEYQIKDIRAYTILNNKAYVVNFHTHIPKSGEVDMMEEYLDTFLSMLKSFNETSTVAVI